MANKKNPGEKLIENLNNHFEKKDNLSKREFIVICSDILEGI